MSRTAPTLTALRPDTPVAAMAGIGPKRAAALAERGIVTALDLILHLPVRYQDWRTRTPPADLKAGTTAILEGELSAVSERPMPGARWRRLATGWLRSGGQRVRLVWFNLPAYMRGRFPAGERVLVCGRVSEAPGGGIEFVHPEVHAFSWGEPRPIRPVYRLPAVVGQRLFATLVAHALSELSHFVRGALPEELRDATPSLPEALTYLHDPPADADFGALARGDSQAHRALAFDELFAFELALVLERARAARRIGISIRGSDGLPGKMLSRLPFALTGAQQRAIGEIAADLARPTQMNRMLMGDVGSGKTLVALWAAVRTVDAGFQVAMMAPTELLAEQHFATFRRFAEPLGVRGALLTGKVTGGARMQVLRGLATGEVAVVFGTQALIQEGLRIKRLGLGIVDEQHRFGVFDRARLRALGPEANVLMMTATPIPRSLAMSLFANLDVSFLDELPPGRTPVATDIFTDRDLERVHEIVRAELDAGRRAYYVLPLIESDEDEEEDLRSASAMAERLSKDALAGYRVGLLHGRMRPAEKERVMREFRDGAINVLVATTVVEVGIDVPDATVIAVIAAERYGLAQLHQLRGRVGRGQWPSRCLLVASHDADAAGLERLQVMARTASGAEVAEADLMMRGPGDLLGARQTGALPLKFIHLIRDHQAIDHARRLAERWLERDPALASPASEGARAALKRMLSLGFSLGDVG
jgi:ATP-dependent DNA helicase RecG